MIVVSPTVNEKLRDLLKGVADFHGIEFLEESAVPDGQVFCMLSADELAELRPAELDLDDEGTKLS